MTLPPHLRYTSRCSIVPATVHHASFSRPIPSTTHSYDDTLRVFITAVLSVVGAVRTAVMANLLGNELGVAFLWGQGAIDAAYGTRRRRRDNANLRDPVHAHGPGEQEHRNDPAEASPSAQEPLEGAGAGLQALYRGSTGEYDGIAIADVPDGEAVERFRLAFDREGTRHLEGHDVSDAEDYPLIPEEATADTDRSL